MNHFIYKLTDDIHNLNTGYPVQIGKFTEEEALVIIPTQGSSKIYKYMDGKSELRLSFDINIKSKSQEEALNVLTDVINNLTDSRNFLDKEKQPSTLLNIAVEQLPYFAPEQEIGYFIYNSKIVVDIMESN